MMLRMGMLSLLLAVIVAGCGGGSSKDVDAARDLTSLDGPGDLSRLSDSGPELVSDLPGFPDTISGLDTTGDLPDLLPEDTLSQDLTDLVPADLPLELTEEIQEDTVWPDTEEIIPYECDPVEFVYPPCDPEGGPVYANGMAGIFGPPFGVVKGGLVSILELPGVTTLTDNSGWFYFDNLPRCTELTFVLEMEGFRTVQTETFFSGEVGLDEIAFQVLTNELWASMETLFSGGEVLGDRCHMASTVSVKEMSLNHYIVPHGYPGAEVKVCPYLPPNLGPIYFEYITDALIVPYPDLTETSIDGGVMYRLVPAGIYKMTASVDDGATFREVKMNCRPGAFVNSAPPWGMHELEPEISDPQE